MTEFLLDVVESQLYYDLTEGSISLAALYCLGIPYYIVDLCCVALLVEVFSDFS